MHSKLNAGLFKLGLRQDGNCITCGVEQDNVHFLMQCIETEELRNSIEKVIKKPKSTFKFLELVSDNRILEAIANYVVSKQINF